MRKLSFFAVLTVCALLSMNFANAQKYLKYSSHRQISLAYEDKIVQAEIVVDKTIKAKRSKEYYWYDNENIHKTVGGYRKYLLDGPYLELYVLDKQMLKKGTFKQGLKNGVWVEWFKNGNIKQEIRWKNGVIHGSVIERNNTGDIIKQQLWENGVLVSNKKDDLFSYKMRKIKHDLKEMFKRKKGNAKAKSKE